MEKSTKSGNGAPPTLLRGYHGRFVGNKVPEGPAKPESSEKNIFKIFLNIVEGLNTNFKENIIKTAIVFVILATVYLLSGNIFLSFIIGVALGILLLGWDSRVFIGFGLVFLIACPFLLAFEKKTTAEQMAVYAYYMLALGVIMQILIYFKDTVFSEKKAVNANCPKPVELWSKKKKLIYLTGTVFLVFSLFAGFFSFLYFKIENKLNENNKLISSLMDTRVQDNPQVEGVSTEKLPGINDPKNVKISVENTTGEEGLEVKVANEYKKLNYLNVSSSKTDTALSQGTYIQYCTICSVYVSELSSVLLNQSELLIIENPDLVDEIIIKLGTDQVTIENSEFNISILNGSTVSGVAKNLQTKMIEQGFNVTKVGDADKNDYTTTIIKYSPDNLEKANIIKEYLSIRFNNLMMLEDPKLLTNIEIVLGNQ